MTAQIIFAFTLANSFSTELITLAVAMIGLTVTFAKDFQQNTLISRTLLISIWALFLFSIVFGIFDIKALISIVGPLKPTDAPLTFTDDALSLAFKQELLFFLGLFLFIIQGVVSVFAKRK
jgi:hypothetical protein